MRLRALWQSSTLRFVALVFVLQFVSAAAILVTVQVLAERGSRNASRERVLDLRQDLIAAHAAGGERALARMIGARLPSRTGDAILLTGSDGRVLAGNLGAWPPTVAEDGRWHVVELYRTDADRPARIGLIGSRLADGDRLLVGRVVEDEMRLTGVLEEAMLGALLLALPLALLGALIAAKMVDVRVARIAGTVRAVAAGDLARRVEPDGAADAFASLGVAVNDMLDRIEALVSELRLVTDGLAHDLRSPLTRLRAALERGAREVDDPTTLAVLDRVSTEVETLMAMLTTALEISRAEAGIGRDNFVPTDLGDIVAELVELYAPLAEDRGQILSGTTTGNAMMPVHRELIGQALANLIDNALKYGSTRGRILLKAERIAAEVRLSVSDTGPGIAPADRAAALRRFGRLDPARRIGGAGLGLALVTAVARLHGGTVVLEDAMPGLRVVIHLPVAG